MEAPTVTVSTIVSGIDTVVDCVEKVWDVMISNPLLLAFLSASLLCVGIRIFRKVKSVAKG